MLPSPGLFVSWEFQNSHSVTYMLTERHIRRVVYWSTLSARLFVPCKCQNSCNVTMAALSSYTCWCWSQRPMPATVQLSVVWINVCEWRLMYTAYINSLKYETDINTFMHKHFAWLRQNWGTPVSSAALILALRNKDWFLAVLSWTTSDSRATTTPIEQPHGTDHVWMWSWGQSDCCFYCTRKQ